MKIVKFVILAAVTVLTVLTFKDVTRDLGAQSVRPSAPDQAQTTASTRSERLYWQARHETGNLEEYSWWREGGVPTGTLRIIPDPTDSGRGSVLSGEITAVSPPGGGSHRLYPALLLPECYRGSYRSSFSVWADLPPSTERGWFSFATYSNKLEWKDLFGVNLGFEQGEDRLVLFHVPVFGKGVYKRISAIPFPLRQWVKIDVQVGPGGILLLQDGRPVAEAEKEWGPGGVGLCEAHWGAYGEGKNRRGLILNDDISIDLDRPFHKPPRLVRSGSGGTP